MIDRAKPISVKRQCELLSLNRSTFYYQASDIDSDTQLLMQLIDEIHLQYPFYGSRRIRDHLQDRRHAVNRKCVQRLMKMMGIEGLYPRFKTTRPNKAHRIYPYRLRELEIVRANQVWCADITYVPMAKGFLYLVAIMDWHSRKVLARRLSNSMDTSFCIDALEEALALYDSKRSMNDTID